jgi:nitroreductase
MGSDHPKTARTDHDVIDLIARRWSPRAFDSTKDVTRAELLRLFEAARWAPSGQNEQPWRFVVIVRRESPTAFEALLAALLPKNRSWAEAAPVLVLVAVDETRKYGPSAGAWYDAGQAVAFLTLQATAMRLSVRQMEGFATAAAREACNVPASFTPAVIMAIGYAGDPDALPHESHRVAERQPRTRRALSEFVFDTEWGRAF